MKMLTINMSVALLLLVLVSVNAHVPPELMPVVEECAKELGMSMEYLKDHDEPPEDKKCMYKCFAVKTGVMSADGVPNFPAFKAQLAANGAPADMIAKVDQCSSIKFDDPCETARAVAKCVEG